MDDTIATVIGDTALILIISFGISSVAQICRVPAVVGQIIAGICLGPTLLGRLPGNLGSHLFPSSAHPYLNAIAQIAVVIFMFSVGYEIEFSVLRNRKRTIPLLMSSTLCIPMILGILCVLTFHGNFISLGENPGGHSFPLFMGVAVSITALPVLAAIVRERGLAGTNAGIIAMTAAGGMDAIAWVLLAMATIGTGHSGTLPWYATLAVTICFAAVMLTIVSRVLSWWMNRSSSVLSDPTSVAIALAMSSAWVTAALGLHPIFGGFLAGLTMRAARREPDPDLLHSMDQAGKQLLPLYFVVTGFSVNIAAMRAQDFAVLALVLVAAAAGKLGPGYAASRLSGLNRRDSATVATLINTRGLTELIALNVGLADGLIHQRLFTILVLMALITTLLTGPLLSLIKPTRAPWLPTVEERIKT